jgi:hypothetical protein
LDMGISVISEVNRHFGTLPVSLIVVIISAFSK